MEFHEEKREIFYGDSMEANSLHIRFPHVTRKFHRVGYVTWNPNGS